MATTRTQDCVIGSGAGGGVLAQRLAAAGRAVVLLEEGPKVGRQDFNQREGEMQGLLYRDGGSQATSDGAIAVLQGRCLGGSTTINMGDCVPIEDGVLEHWRQHHRWGDWGGITNADVAAAAAAVMADMGAGPIPEEEINKANRLLRDGAAKLAIAGTVLQHNRTGCVGSGYCTIGCAYDAKRGTLLSHIPAAIAAGCVLMADSRVDSIERSGGTATAVVGEGFRVECERVFVAAGAIHSPGVLQRSGVTGDVGSNLTLQPQAPVVALFEDDVIFFRGIPQSYGVDGPLHASVEHGLTGYTIEGVSAGPAMAASMIPLPMDELLPLLAGYPKMAASLCLVPDQPSGRVQHDKNGRPKIKYRMSARYKDTLREAVRAAARLYMAAGAQRVLLPATGAVQIRSAAEIDAAVDALSLRECDLTMISAHPQGTCRMAGDGADGAVVGMDFRLLGSDNVYVCDTSIFPTSASSHTMVPTMTMAHLLAAQLGA